MTKSRYDCVVIGGGHNGLVAAAYLGGAGKSVLLVERADEPGGATASCQVFPDYEAWLSRYSYLVSLLPQTIVDELGLEFRTARRTIASFTPWTDDRGVARGLLLSNTDPEKSRQSVFELRECDTDWTDYQQFLRLQQAYADLVWPTILQPLKSRESFASRLQTPEMREAWELFVDQPLGVGIERYLHHDALRGLVLTDGKIGVLTHAHDDSLLQNRCFLWHVVGGGTGEWRVPVGGMRSLVDALVRKCVAEDVTVLTGAPATHVDPDGDWKTVTVASESGEIHVECRHVLMNCGPRTQARLLGVDPQLNSDDEGTAVKINMLLRRLPRLRASGIDPREAFTGSFHIDEGYRQLHESWEAATEGRIPDPAPGEIYCHTLTDDSILSPELREAGYQTLTLFGLDMAHRLFRGDNHDLCRERVLRSFMAGLNRLCDEPFEDCLAQDADGRPCVEIKTPVELEKELDLDQGNIFHNGLSWFFAESSDDVGRWGVETRWPGVYRAGSSALRGGAVSGVPGRCAALAVLGTNSFD